MGVEVTVDPELREDQLFKTIVENRIKQRDRPNSVASATAIFTRAVQHRVKKYFAASYW